MMTDTVSHSSGLASNPAPDSPPAGLTFPDVPPGPDFPPGWVWLVGAGPGDPGLLTLHALHALRQADVIVYDALVDDRILALAPATTERLYAGKRGGRPSAKQADISETLVSLAKAGRRVLRLKGGDPFVFGRGAEECQFLHAHGIPFRVVPGITAGIGGLAAAGIPATVRETNAAITFITGHAANGDVPDSLNWAALAHGSPVLVFYMGLKHLPVIVDRLISAGRSADTPAAAVAEATTPRQRVVTATLGTLTAAITAAGLHPPAIVVVGEVVSLRDVIAAGAKPGER